ncbi:MAG: hypothetical protein JXB88_11730 [Spirochaetales bacterium]|nr:hypothetical protein [Spirochaetales bacterium]
MANRNLDKLAGEVALQICNPDEVTIDILERIATKALGVLQEQGVYAMIVFLLSRSGNEQYNKKKESKESKSAILCIDSLNGSLKKEPMNFLSLKSNNVTPLQTKNDNNGKKAILQMYLKISESLETLLLVKEFYEQILIYVRHICKGLQ